jgi:transcriptional regulator with XRE-family HTH domain
MSNPLLEYRTTYGYTQGQLADLLGCSRALLSMIEIGARPITPENADEWAPKMGVSRAKLCPLLGRRKVA